MNFLSSLLTPFVAFGMLLGSLFSQEPEVINIGASQEIPTTIAFFETTLASAISSSATSFTLTSATDKDGTTLASSTYAFVIDEGSSNEEIVLADCTSTACTNVERGISVRTGNTEVTALKKAHRRGASVKMTDAPILPLMARIMRGEGTVDYTPSQGGNLVTKTYVDTLALGTTTVAATETDDGMVELATQIDMSSSTPIGGSGSSLVLQSKYATSSCQVVGRYIPITDPTTGKVDSSCLDSTYATSSLTIGSTPISDIGKWVYASTTSGTSTWAVPTGTTKIKVTLVGSGSKGAAGTGGVSGGGGGAGGTCIKWYDVSATTSIQFHIGSAGTDNGQNSFFGGSYLAPVMLAYLGGVADASGKGGLGGTATGCDLNFDGGDGGGVTTASTDPGMGGNSIFGGAGANGDGVGGGSAGTNAGACGSGGGGGYDGSSGGSGSSGCLIIEY